MKRSIKVRQIEEVELLREHWVNGQRFPPGTVLCLPSACSSNLIRVGAARPKESDEPETATAN